MNESFFMLGTQARLGKENQLLKLNRLIDWERVRKILPMIHKNELDDKGGQRAYDKLAMFKAVLLGQWHNLSDPELEEGLRVRLDFMAFTGFELSEELPDETTLCRFRNQLRERGILQRLLDEINMQLTRIGLKVKACQGAVVDATVIESAARPRRVIEVYEDGQEAAGEQSSAAEYMVRESADDDARWLKKGKRSYYGYRGFVRTDSAGYIESAHVTPANIAEVKEFKAAVAGSKARLIMADKGFASGDNRKWLRAHNYKDGIMEKAVRGRALTHWQKLKNKLISRSRYIVEQTFGTLKRRFGLCRARYFGLQKVEAQLTMKALCLNLLKAVNAMN